MDPGIVKTADRALSVYLLGQIEFEAALTLQRALVYQVSGERDGAALLLCEHPPLITVGREGNPAQIALDPGELRARRWPVRWVNRGGGCVLHLPGQLTAYPILALDARGLGVRDYIEGLRRVVVAVLDDFSVRAATPGDRPGVWVGDRLIATVGIAVRDWVAYYGVTLNVHPDLVPLRLVNSGGPMTSLERERRGPLRLAMVRERFIEHFVEEFPFERTSLFFHHAQLQSQAFPIDRPFPSAV